MILEEETFKKFGYMAFELTRRSGKKIVVSCDRCGKIRVISKHDYRGLCRGCSRIGRTHTIESIRKMREAALNRTDETKERIRNGLRGKIHTEDTKKKISESVKRNMTTEKRREISAFMKERFKNPDNHPMWKGGISFDPYCIKFNNDFKERVRNYFNRCCYVCGKNETENKGKLCVHHVMYNKDTCCDNSKPLFVPLCRSCHAKTNFDREYWQEFFTISLEYLTNGKCYLERGTNDEKY